MDAALLREWQDRGQFFYERFPGAAAAENWKQQREKAERELAAAARQNQGSQSEEKEDAAGSRSSSLGHVVLTVAGSPPQSVPA
jgi:hypothetical protein